MLRTSRAPNTSARRRKRSRCSVPIPFVPSSIVEAEIPRGGGGIGQLAVAHRVEGRVVADLEQVDIQRPRRLERADQAAAARRPGRSAARRTRRCRGRSCFVSLTLARHRCEAPRRREGGCFIQHRDEIGGVVRESAEEQPVDGVAEFRQQSGSGRAAVDDRAAGAVGIRIERGAQRAGRPRRCARRAPARVHRSPTPARRRR